MAVMPVVASTDGSCNGLTAVTVWQDVARGWVAIVPSG
jgi:hypothetical protein